MAIGVIGTDVDQFNTNFNLGEMETISQNIAALQAAGGIFRLTDRRLKGQYVRNTVKRYGGSGVSRRDPTSTSAATDISVQATSDTRVKLKRTWGPYANTKDAWYEMLADAGGDPLQLAQDWGVKAAEEQQQDWLNSGLRAAAAALNAQSDNKYTVPSSGTLDTQSMIKGAATFGDAFMGRVRGLIMHSKPFYDLIEDQVVTLKTTGISDIALADPSQATGFKPVIVTDSDALVSVTGTGTAATTDYFTLALVDGAVTLDNARPLDAAIDEITGLDNLVIRIQAEYDFTVGVKGFQWDETNGGANPTDAAVATGSNWDKVGTTKKDLAGIIIQSR